jgi:hypothetical protein
MLQDAPEYPVQHHVLPDYLRFVRSSRIDPYRHARIFARLYRPACAQYHLHSILPRLNRAVHLSIPQHPVWLTSSKPLPAAKSTAHRASVNRGFQQNILVPRWVLANVGSVSVAKAALASPDSAINNIIFSEHDLLLRHVLVCRTAAADPIQQWSDGHLPEWRERHLEPAARLLPEFFSASRVSLCSLSLRFPIDRFALPDKTLSRVYRLRWL